MVQIRLRFYLPHDMDLISLMITHEMDIVHALYCAITAFAKQEVFVIKIPPLREKPMDKKRVYHKNLILDPEKDQKVLSLLEEIEPGYRNSFLKNVLRLYLYRPATESFLIHPQYMEELEKQFAVFTDGKRVADAASLKPKKRKVSLPKVESKPESTVKKEQLNDPIPVSLPSAEEGLSEKEDDDLTDLFESLLS